MPGFKVGYGYGSECHLLRYLGWHRQLLDARILECLGSAGYLRWYDFWFHCQDSWQSVTGPKTEYRNGVESTGKEGTWHRRTWQDKERTGLDFLDPICPELQNDWDAFRPPDGNTINWDAVARLETHLGPEILLIEAKAHVDELSSNVGAGASSAASIGNYMNRVKAGLAAPVNADWLQEYYQHANHLTALWILRNHGYRAQLIQVFFTGDQAPGKTCPQNEAQWLPHLQKRDNHMGLPSRHALSDYMHRLFLPVCL